MGTRLYRAEVSTVVYLWSDESDDDSVIFDDAIVAATEAFRDGGGEHEVHAEEVGPGHCTRGWDGLPYGEDPTGQEREVHEIIAAMPEGAT